jgi:hypothetical protein
MAFDIRQNLFDRDGMPVEKKVGQYLQELIRLFRESPEGQVLEDEGLYPGFWVNSMVDYGIDYLGVSPARLSPDQLRELLFDIFPRKVSADADEAPQAIHELQAFWQFAQREFQLENAAACLKVLDDKAVRQMKKEMSNPANFGMAKSIVMMGKARGFDMTTEEGMNEWIATYNAEMAPKIAPRHPMPAERSGSAEQTPGAGLQLSSYAWLSAGRVGGSRNAQNKIKRRMARNSQKKNRKK